MGWLKIPELEYLENGISKRSCKTDFSIFLKSGLKATKKLVNGC